MWQCVECFRPASAGMLLAFPTTDLFALSVIPFCSGVWELSFDALYPTSSGNPYKSLLTYSVPLSV
jgi:hypothetical protein